MNSIWIIPAIVVAIAVAAIALVGGVNWLTDKWIGPDIEPDHDFLRASDWRDGAEAEVEQLKNPDHAAMRKWIRGDQ